MIFNYFYTKKVCEDNVNELMTMSILNFVMITITMCAVLLKSPIRVVDNRVDLNRRPKLKIILLQNRVQCLSSHQVAEKQSQPDSSFGSKG